MMPTPRLSKWLIATITGVTLCVAGSKTPAQVGDDALRFEGHTLLVTTVAFSPDGKRLLVQSGDGVTIHDATTGKRLAKMEGPRSAHGMSVFSPDGKFVAGVVDFQLNVWDSATGKSVFQSPSREIYGNDEDVIAYSPDGKLVATPELVLKASDGVKVGRFKNSNGDPLRLDSRVLFSPDGEMLVGIASVSGSKKVITCRLPSGLVDATTSADVVFDTDNTLGDTDDIALSAEGRVLARLKGRAVVLRMLAGGTQPDIDCEQPEFRPAGIAFHPGGKYVAIAGERSVQLFDVQTGKSAAAFNIGEGKGINSLAFSPDGSRMALGMWEQPSVLVWDVATGMKARIAAQEAAAKAETDRLAEIERKTAEIRAKRAEEKRQAEIEAAALRERMKQQAAEREAEEAEARRLAEIAAASRREQMQKEAAEREAKEVEARRLAEIEEAAQKDREKQLAAAGIVAAAKTAKMDEVGVGAKSDSAEVPVSSDGGKKPIKQAEKVDDETRARAMDIVQSLLGETSQHYDEHGYKGVRLGTSFKEIAGQRDLKNNGDFDGLFFLYTTADKSELFIFGSDDALVCYGRRYRGGFNDYKDEIISVFGTCPKNRLKTSRTSRGNNSRDLVTAEYTYETTLVKIVFETLSHADGIVEDLTWVWVADRTWVEELLYKSAIARLKAGDWVMRAAEQVRQSGFDTESLPKIAGTRTELFSIPGEGDRPARGVHLFNIDREREIGDGPRNMYRGYIACGQIWEQTSRGERQGGVVFKCSGCPLTRIDIQVREQPHKQTTIGNMAYNAVSIPVLGDLLWGLNQWIMEGAFPPEGGQVKGNAQEVRWEHTEASGNTWTVICFQNQMIELIYKVKKRL